MSAISAKYSQASPLSFAWVNDKIFHNNIAEISLKELNTHEAGI